MYQDYYSSNSQKKSPNKKRTRINPLMSDRNYWAIQKIEAEEAAKDGAL